MASVDEETSIPLNRIMVLDDVDNTGNVDTDLESIPYHARENALPFSYGNIPLGFNTSNLNHIADIVEHKVNMNAFATCQSNPKRNQRPSITTSCPLLRKTPSREEFDNMLMERKNQHGEITKDLGKNKFEHDKILNVQKKNQVQLCDPAALVKSTDNTCSNLNLQLVETKRSETPTFPTSQRSISSERCISPYPMIVEDTSIRYSDETIQTREVEPHLVKFAQDSSEFWYKPNMSREEAVDLLRNVVPGTFLIRNSTTYPNAFGLVLRVAKPPPGVVTRPGYGDELVRHFLLEPTTWGVRLMGCKSEPIFTSLSAFVYEHSINQLSLPCSLIIPDQDIVFPSNNHEIIYKHKQLMAQGAACNVLYLYQTDMESLTGNEAVQKSVYLMLSEQKRPIPLEVHFKVSAEGITLTDNSRKQFFRRHYPAKNISHFGMDPTNHLWSVTAVDEGLQRLVNKSIFAFIARPLTGSKDNQCHVFCDLTCKQPASAIVSFAHKVLKLHN
ncbi:hypothetical protein KR093_004003 [Drosophila rubida]|uniref:SH2 domain-containing protein n=1 Tax=Drosophila rubida TaxID=30044 RepID=A0AAD4JSV3_9MUSC|nr:hypothetical protein KR093_004003 [Drosophila rubida]